MLPQEWPDGDLIGARDCKETPTGIAMMKMTISELLVDNKKPKTSQPAYLDPSRGRLLGQLMRELFQRMIFLDTVMGGFAVC